MARAKWGREHERLRQEILAMLARGHDRPPFAGLEPEELDALKRAPFGEWCHTFLPDWFSAPDAPFHPERDILRNTVGTPVGMCWFGGAGKTVRYTIAWTIYLVCHGRWVCDLTDGTRVALPTHDAEERADVVAKTRIVLHVIGCRNLRKATEHLDVVRVFLKRSAELRAAYGDAITPSEGQDSEKDCLANGVRMLALGIQQSLRGTLHAGHRVQSIIWDDVENNEIAASKEREDKLADQMFGDWIPRCEGAGDGAIMVMVMNQYRSRHCQARRWKRMAAERDKAGRPRVIFDVVALDDGEFHSNWPALYPDEMCKRIAFRVGPLRYRVEFRCMEVDEEAQFKADWFVTFNVAAWEALRPAAIIVGALDPSATETATSDYKAWIVLAKLVGKAEIYTLDAWIRRADPETVIRRVWYMEERWPAIHLAAEINGFQRLYWRLYRMLCEKEGRGIRTLHPINNHRAKVGDRILSTVGELSQRLCYFDPSQGDQQRLIDQFLDIGTPSCKHDDGPDAWEMARRMLYRVERMVRAGAEPEPDEAELRRETIKAQLEPSDGWNPGEDPWVHVNNPAMWS